MKDLNLRPFRPKRNALPDCANRRKMELPTGIEPIYDDYKSTASPLMLREHKIGKYLFKNRNT